MASTSTEKNPKSERNKMIAAIALGVVALLTLWYAFFSGSSTSKTAQTTASNSNKTLAPRGANQTSDGRGTLTQINSPVDPATEIPRPIPIDRETPAGVPEVSRNIFAFYVPPPKPIVTPTPEPPPAPTPPPPVLVSGLSPTNVYARTGDFKLDVSGDKFTPQTRVFIDGRELETRYISPQQLSATVPSAVITYEGARQIIVRTPDGTIYSNTVALSVAAPPAPNYTYVGLVGGSKFNDTAILKDKNTKNLINVTRGDPVGGRFRVTSISQREVVLVDTNLRIKHTLPLTSDTGGQQGGPPRPPSQPQPVTTDGDDEP